MTKKTLSKAESISIKRFLQNAPILSQKVSVSKRAETLKLSIFIYFRTEQIHIKERKNEKEVT